jgi:dTDP-4-dehydrorhamnose reductase
MRILVTGKNGQLGQSIKKIVNKKRDFFLNNCAFVFVGRSELDLRNVTSIHTYFDKNKFDIVINCAAYTNVDKAEADEEQAYLNQSLAVKEIAKIAKNNNMKLIHISTDFVFDGLKINHILKLIYVSPVNVYGKLNWLEN